MSTGFLIPLLIILGCVSLIGVVAVLTRKKPALWDIFPGSIPKVDPDMTGSNSKPYDSETDLPGPLESTSEPGASTVPNSGSFGDAASKEVPAGAAAPSSPANQPSSELENLTEWHQLHESTVAAWIETHQKVLSDIQAAKLQINLQDRDAIMKEHDQMAPEMRKAIASHPSSIMRAELSAMHVAGQASVFAVIRSDYETARRQHLVYVQYRDEWIERLRQFSGNPMTNLRAIMHTTEFMLEEIRSALDSALDETVVEESKSEADFEAPLVIPQEQQAVLNLENQPEEAMKEAVDGSPNDTTADMEDGWFHRFYRRLFP